MADQKISDMPLGALTATDNLYFLRGTTQDFRLDGNAVKAWTDQNAAGVPFTPTGGISATNVQNALAELDSEKIGGITNEQLGDLSDVTISAPVTDHVLLYNGSIWVNGASPGGGGGEANDGLNIGSGLGQSYQGKSGATLQFRTINSTDNALNVSTSSNTVDMSIDRATAAQDGVMTAADKSKLNTVVSGAQPNTNSFERIQVGGQGDVVADNDTDILTLVAGSDIQITTNPGTDTITIAASAGVPSSSIGDLNDVDTTTSSPIIGEHLEWDGSNWVPGAAGGVVANLDDIGDVTITTPIDDQVLTYSGGVWVNAAPGGGGGGEANDGVNLGTGTGVYVGKSGATLQFHSLLSQTPALLIQDIGNEIGYTIANAVSAGNSGLMTGADKQKLDGISPGATNNTGTNLGAGVGVYEDDSGGELRFNSLRSQTSALTISEDNPNNEIDFTIADAQSGGASGLLSGTDKQKLDGIAAGAQPNQDAFRTFSVSGQTDVVADLPEDTMTFVAGTNMTITTNATTDTITFDAAGSSGATELNELTDVDTTGEAQYDALIKTNGTYTPMQVPVVNETDSSLVGQMQMAVLTQAEYDGITPDANTVYFIV